MSVARPGAARRGRRRGPGARGRLRPARHDGAVPVPGAVGHAGTATGSTVDPHRRADRRPARTACWRSARCPTPRGIGPGGGRASTWTRAASSRSTGSRGPSARGVYAAGDCTGVLMLASVAAMQGRIAMWHALGDAVSPLDLNDGVVERLHRTGDRHRRRDPDARSTPARSRRAPSRCRCAGNARAKMQGITRRLRQAVLPPRTGIVIGGVVVAPQRQRADLPARRRRRAAADRRPDGALVHGLPLADRVDRRGRPPAAREPHDQLDPVAALGIVAAWMWSRSWTW